MVNKNNNSNPRISVIGVGGWGKNHARVLGELGVLGAVCDFDPARAKEIATKHGAAPYSSVDEMLEKERLDACLVCTPTRTHSAVAKKVMEKGLHAFVEKPLSFSSQECDEMAELARKKHVLLTCGYIERFNPAVSETKKMIADKKCGDLLMLEFHRENRMPPKIKDVGIIFDTAVHDIDTAMFLFDARPNVVFARAGRHMHEFEDFATLMLGFANQRVAIISVNWLTPKKVRTFSAVCTDGIISGNFISQEVKIDNAGETVTPRMPFEEPLTLELKSFIAAVQGKENSAVSARDATNVTKVAEAALLSSDTGSPIYLDLK
ncbi:MAG: Gfo/Idh/MocA family oxidoreductase [Nitrososphaera sp.]